MFVTTERGSDFETRLTNEALLSLHASRGSDAPLEQYVVTEPRINLTFGTALMRGLILDELADFEEELNDAGLLISPANN